MTSVRVIVDALRQGEKFRQFREIYARCEEVGVHVPVEVYAYFGNLPLVEIPPEGICTRIEDGVLVDTSDGEYIISMDSVPQNTTSIRVRFERQPEV